MRVKLMADDVTVWSGDDLPTQHQIDRAANAANLRGWNGTQFDVTIDGEWSESVNPSEAVLV